MYKIIVRMPNWLGDFVMALPVLKALKKAYPQAKITVLVKGSLKELIEEDPNIDQVWVLSGNTTSKIKKEKFDLGILLTNSFSSAWQFFRGRVKTRLGYKKDFRFFLLNLKRSLPKKTEHQVITYQKLLKALKKKFVFEEPRLYVNEYDLKKAENRLQEMGVRKDEKIIAFSPFAAFGNAKCWPLRSFYELTQMVLAKTDYSILFLGDKKSKEAMKTINLPKERVYNLVGKTSLKELVLMLKLSSLVVTGDSGPMHVANALGKDLVALFGSTNPKKTSPFLNEKSVIYKKFECSPCYFRECERLYFCMDAITKEQVFAKIAEILKLDIDKP